MADNSFKIKNSLVLTPIDLATLTNPQAGDLACDINDSNKIKRYDANSSAWTEVGSGGGVGGTDIFFVQDFESASLSSFTQIGLVLSQTDPLHGRVSALLTHQAAINQSFKQIIPVDRKFRGESMTLRLNAKSNASAGNVTINIYDETNAANLVASQQLQLSNDVSGAISRVGFTIPSTCASISYTITALPEAGSPVTRIDDIIAELAVTSLLETSVEVPNVTGWQGYTPTFQGFGTPSNIEFEWRQVGESVEIRGKFTAGVSTSVEARVGLPGGLTSAGTGIIPSLSLAGDAVRTSSGTTYFRSNILIEPSVSYVTFGSQTSTTGAITKAVASFVGSSEQISITASIPCSGLSATTTKTIPLTQSGLVQEVDSTLKVNTPVRGTTSTGVYNFTNTQTSIGSDVLFQASATLGSTFTIQKTGVYALSFSVVSSLSNSTSASAGISRNQTSAGTTAAENLNAAELLALSRDTDITGGAAKFSSTSWTGLLNVGDIIRFHGNPGDVAVASSSTATISYQGSLKQIAVSSDQKLRIPTSELRFEGASSRGSTATAIVRFDTMAKLRGDAFTVVSDAVNGTAITMLKAGKLDVSTSLFSNVANQVHITRNQSNLTTLSSIASEILSSEYSPGAGDVVSPAWSGFVNVGDIIRINTSAAVSVLASNSLNLSFQEQDISVSVTNTLPQFSESDSSVRVDTSNGYGSASTNKIRRFSNVRDNIGTDIVYVDDSVNGATFTVRSAGTYHISATDNFAAAGRIIITKNQSNLTAVPGGVPASEILRASQITVAGSCSCSWEGYLVAGDIVRLSTDGTGTGSDAAFTGLTISKVGKPNVTGVDVTPFVQMPFEKAAVGEIKAFAGNIDGEYFLPCDGSAVNRGTYAQLFAKIGITHGQGDGSTTFNLPDYRGRFLRGVTGASANDPDAASRTEMATGGNTGNNVGSVQGDGNLSHTHVHLSRSTISLSGGGTANVAVSNTFDNATYTGEASGGNESRPKNAYVNYGIRFKTATDSILTAPETFSTDTASLTYAGSGTYTLTTLSNAPVGTYITFTYAANTNTRTQTTTRPTQTDADMNVNGILLTTRIYANAGTAAEPRVFAIQIGKGMKGVSKNLYKSAGKVTAGTTDFVVSSSTNQGGLYYKDYNESTGILIIDTGVCALPTNTVNTFSFSDVSSQTSGYLVINASKSPVLVGVPQLIPRIATLSDVKASGTAGGTATSGSYQTRTLNTLSDPTGIVTSLASNQFTLPAGEYYIEAFAPTYGTGTNKFKIRNVTDSIDSIIGPSNYAALSASGDRSSSSGDLKGTLVISSSKTFELQHRVSSTKATDGYGAPATFGDNEVYSILKIQKIK